jgi:hypothetical protein
MSSESKKTGVPGIGRVARRAHLHIEDAFVKVGKCAERGASEVDVLRRRGATGARVNNAYVDALLRAVADCAGISAAIRGKTMDRTYSRGT